MNINISSDGHPITFVEAYGGRRPVRRDWLIYLIDISLNKIIIFD